MARSSPRPPSDRPVLLWWRDDLRLADNPALAAAAASGRPVVSIYVLDGESPGVRPLGGASAWWLHHSLEALAASIEAIGGAPMLFFRGPARDVLARLASALDPAQVVWNRRYPAAERAVDDEVAKDLEAAAIEVQTFNGSLLHEPDEIVPKGGGYYHVYAAYWRASQARAALPDPLPPPRLLPGPGIDPGPLGAVALDGLELLPRDFDWTASLHEVWRPGEAAGQEALEHFVRARIQTYEAGRNDLSADGSSRLSPHLRHGEVSPVTVARVVRGAKGNGGHDREKFMQELTWRDFTYNLLAHAPEITDHAYAERFQHFPWRKPTTQELKAWQRGRTGYPIVDAGMRQLWTTGWMHNRVRMITASFLVKHLLVDWKVGESWFWDTLCDADPANNVVNWQWVAGCGPDAAPFFRIFNPVLQGEKFDPDGSYTKRFVPELERLAPAWIHKPWDAPSSVLTEAGVELGRTYPRPIVDHAEARTRALDLFRATRPGTETAA